MVAASLEPCLAMAEQRSKQTNKKRILNWCTTDIYACLTEFTFKRATFVRAWKPDT